MITLNIKDKQLSFEIPSAGRIKRHDSTPYYEEFCLDSGDMNPDFNRRFYFQCKLADKLKGKYHSLLDPMAGVGIVALLFYDEGVRPMCLNDMDEVCAESLKRNFPSAMVSQDDANKLFEKIWNDDDFDLTFMDWNNFTLKRYLDNELNYRCITNNIFSKTRKYVVINDSTIYYLRYGRKSFGNVEKWLGMRLDSKKDYVRAFRDVISSMYSGWILTDCYMFQNMAYHLFEYGEYGGVELGEDIVWHEVPEDYKDSLPWEMTRE